MQRRIFAIAALAACVVPLPTAVSAAKAAAGVVYGAETSPGYPVVIELSKTGRKVVKASIGLELKCQMPPDVTLPDAIRNVPVSRTGRFRTSQPVTRIDADPATGQPALDVSASVIGRVNKARTRITGTWQRKIVIYNAGDPATSGVFDTCDTGALRFTAKQ